MRIRSGGNRIDHVVVDMSTTTAADDTVAPSERLKINGELVALDARGRLSFDHLQRRLVAPRANARKLIHAVPAS
jgi:ATP-dependent DNA ligase